MDAAYVARKPAVQPVRGRRTAPGRGASSDLRLRFATQARTDELSADDDVNRATNTPTSRRKHVGGCQKVRIRAAGGVSVGP